MKRPCLSPRCPRFASPTGRGRCKECAGERDKQINRAGRRTYSLKKWEMTRRRKLGMSPFCERCHTALANTVHHKVDLAEGGDEWAEQNLESLCTSCHSKIGRKRQLDRHT